MLPPVPLIMHTFSARRPVNLPRPRPIADYPAFLDSGDGMDQPVRGAVRPSRVPSLRFEYKLLVGLAILQTPMGLGGVAHRKVALAAQPERTRGEERHSLVDGFGCSVRRSDRERNTEIGGVLIGKGHHPFWTSGQGDGVLELALPGSVQDGVHRRADVAYPMGQASAVADRDTAEVAHKIVIARRRGADYRHAPGDGQLGGNHPDRAGRTENE